VRSSGTQQRARGAVTAMNRIIDGNLSESSIIWDHCAALRNRRGLRQRHAQAAAGAGAGAVAA